MNYRYGYNFAEVDDATRMCVGVMSTTDPSTDGLTGFGTTYVPIPVYSENYIFKYYINGNWYEDAEGTIPWSPPA